MLRKTLSRIVSMLLLATFASPAWAAPMGRPVSLDITITQGGTVIVDADNVLIPLADPLDGTNYIDIGDLGGGVTDIYLSVELQDETAQEGWVSFYVRAADPTDPLVAGVDPLFDLAGAGMIEVTIENLRFESGGSPALNTLTQFEAPLGDLMAGMYMMNSAGWYYDLPETELFIVGARHTEQVPYSDFRDAIPTYQFDDDTGTNLNVAWRNMNSPVDAVYTVIQSDAPHATATDTSGGAVFEMGLNAFAFNVPEPATAGLLLVGALACFRRRRY